MNMEKCKYLLFCGTLALWMAGGFQQVYAATEPSSQAIQQQSNKVTAVSSSFCEQDATMAAPARKSIDI